MINDDQMIEEYMILNKIKHIIWSNQKTED